MPDPSSSTRDLPRTIGFFGAVGILVGVSIGSGIFRTPASIARDFSNPWIILLLWALGGVLCLFGALAYTELAVLFPRSGGLYNFLYHGFGRSTAFVFGWSYMLLIKPFAAGGIAIVFAEHLNALVGLQPRLNTLVGEQTTVQLQRLLGEHWAMPPLVCVVLVALTAINTIGMRLGSGISVVLTAIKVLALLAISSLAFILPGGSAANFAPLPADKPWYLVIAAVMSGILWTYDGWSDVGSVAGEVKNPQRQLPRIYILGTLLVVALYLAVNAAYFWIIPLAEMRTTDTVAPLVMRKLAGEWGEKLVSAIILISTLGSTHASIITGARVTFAQANDGLLFRFLGSVSRRETPAHALWNQCVLSCVCVLFLQSFQNLAESFVFTMWIFYGLAAVSVIVLRVKRPDLPRTFRCPGYPVVPALFALCAIAMTVMTVATSDNNLPLMWIAILLAGYPVYFIWDRLRRGSSQLA
jgi:APA family basic amino acid/polyamine antiporter